MIGTRFALAGAALSLTLALAACTSSHPKSAPATTVPASTSSSSPGAQTLPTVPATTATTGAPASTTSTAPAGPPHCASSVLTASLANPNGAAGSVYYSLRLTNHGTVSCVLQGYAGVSFVTGPTGQQVGAAAARGTGSAPVISLAPGASAGAVLQITDPTNYGTDCGLTQVAGLRVFPPNQTAPLYIAHPDRACSNTTDVTLHIAAFQPAS
ncbi:MAG TPA: DUF4232 domain-containing protein [Acidimicrobiales bacterium]|nr:DUF4232 domain-containing protein [Acidimicrobiales bacterium]